MSESVIILTIIASTLIIILALNFCIGNLITEYKIRSSFKEFNIESCLEDYRRLCQKSEVDVSVDECLEEIRRLENINKDLRKNNKGLKKGHSSLQKKIKTLENENYCLKQQLKEYEEQYAYLEDTSKGVIYE